MKSGASVGICAHNEEETIGTLINQVLEEEVPVRQVIVVASGDDRTMDIVREKQEEHPELTLVEEEERRGQSAAQNEILRRVEEDAVFLVDGDGVIEPGSLEALWEEYDGESILYGREIPITPDTLGGRLIDRFWEMHHRLSMISPKYTTQLALQPADLVNFIPPEMVVDDEYIGLRALGDGYSIEYIPKAEKHHNIKGDLKSFLRHRRKNWAGMLQMQSYGHENLQDATEKARFYLRTLLYGGVGSRFAYLLLGLIEILALLGALYDAVRGNWPFKWER